MVIHVALITQWRFLEYIFSELFITVPPDISRYLCFMHGDTAEHFSYSLTHGVELLFRSCQLCSYSRTSQHSMEPEGSLRYSQEPSIWSVLEQKAFVINDICPNGCLIQSIESCCANYCHNRISAILLYKGTSWRLPVLLLNGEDCGD
jgi:hypothetical protein